MTPAIAALLLEALIKYGPAVAIEINALFKKTVITPEDWDRVFALCAKTYEDYTKPKA